MGYYYGSIYKFVAKLFIFFEINVFKTDWQWITGAFLLIRGDVIDRAGMLDPDFFMYSEEVEWQSRLRKYGKIHMLNQYSIIHLGQGTHKINCINDKQRYNQWLISNLVDLRKQRGAYIFMLVLVNYIISIPISAFAFVVMNILKKRNIIYNKDLFSEYLRTVLLVLKYSIRIISNKPYFYKVY